MIKTIKIGKKEIALSNNMTWFLIYRNQFGKDILPTLSPAVAALIDTLNALSVKLDTEGRITLGDKIEVLNGEALTSAVIHASGMEFVDFMNIVWAMAKAADPSINDPETWYRELDEFPLDTILPQVGGLITQGLVSRKNAKRLQDAIKKIKTDLKPSKQTQSSSQESSED